MLFDFERLYIWRRRRFFRGPVDVFIVLPKELHLQTILEFYIDNAGAFPSFLSYVEWLGGRVAVPQRDLLSFDLEEVKPKSSRDPQKDASLMWQAAGIDTREIGLKPFKDIRKDIQENEQSQR